MGGPVFAEEFVRRALRLLSLERSAEIAESDRLQRLLSLPELERRGVCLARLQVVGTVPAIGGRTAVRLRRSTGDPLPAHRLQGGTS